MKRLHHFSILNAHFFVHLLIPLQTSQESTSIKGKAMESSTSFSGGCGTDGEHKSQAEFSASSPCAFSCLEGEVYPSCTCHQPRALTSEEQEKLRKDTKLVTEFKQGKLEKEAQKNWDLFYKRNATNFYKDRHWTLREFQDLCCNEVCFQI